MSTSGSFLFHPYFFSPLLFDSCFSFPIYIQPSQKKQSRYCINMKHRHGGNICLFFWTCRSMLRHPRPPATSHFPWAQEMEELSQQKQDKEEGAAGWAENSGGSAQARSTARAVQLQPCDGGRVPEHLVPHLPPTQGREVSSYGFRCEKYFPITLSGPF